MNLVVDGEDVVAGALLPVERAARRVPRVLEADGVRRLVYFESVMRGLRTRERVLVDDPLARFGVAAWAFIFVGLLENYGESDALPKGSVP